MPEKPLKLGLSRLELVVPRIQHDGHIETAGARCLAEAPTFPQEPPGAIALDGPRIGMKSNKDNPIERELIGRHMEAHAAAGIPGTRLEYPVYLGPPADSLPLGKTKADYVEASAPLQKAFPLVRLLLVGSGELQSSFGSAALQDKTTALGLHAGAKTELPGAANFTGLIGAFHDPRAP